MKMEGRDNVECQNWERRDIMVILEFVLNDNKTKRNSDLLLLKMEKKKSCRGDAGSHFQTFRERGSSFSLSFCAIRPSTVFGTKRKAALRGEGFAWVPDLRSFLKLREVGVSPYLGFILCLRAMLMFELNEAVRGRLIGSKSWNRGVGFLKPMWTVRDCPWVVWSAMVKCVL